MLGNFHCFFLLLDFRHSILEEEMDSAKLDSTTRWTTKMSMIRWVMEWLTELLARRVTSRYGHHYTQVTILLYIIFFHLLKEFNDALEYLNERRHELESLDFVFKIFEDVIIFFQVLFINAFIYFIFIVQI